MALEVARSPTEHAQVGVADASTWHAKLWWHAARGQLRPKHRAESSAMPDGQPPRPPAPRRSKSRDEAGSAFRVAVRCRPLLPQERATQLDGLLTLSGNSVAVNDDVAAAHERGLESPRRGSESPRASPRSSPRASPRRERPVKAFSFDHVYDEFCTQEQVSAHSVSLLLFNL